MKTALMILATISLFGCSQQNALLPAAPGTAPGATTTSASVSAMVVDDSGVCIAGATIEAVSGQSQGEKVTQNTPCAEWDYGGAAVFKNLTAGIALTLRASAVGYVTQEKSVVPSSGAQLAVVFTPSRMR